jgi:hypothetical protein
VFDPGGPAVATVIVLVGCNGIVVVEQCAGCIALVAGQILDAGQESLWFGERHGREERKFEPCRVKVGDGDRRRRGQQFQRPPRRPDTVDHGAHLDGGTGADEIGI